MQFVSRLMVRARALLNRSRTPQKRGPRARPCLELLETREMLHANAVLDAEHLAVFGTRDPVTQVITGGLVPDVAVTDQSVASGNWSDPTIWSNGVPKNGDNVLISSGTVITIDGNESIDANKQRLALRTIRDDGTLRFATQANTTLLVDTIIVEPSGTFEMGTVANPIDASQRARVIFADLAKPLEDNLAKGVPGSQAALNNYEAQRLAWDPLQFGLGLVTHGEVRINGSPVTSWLQGGLDSALKPLDLKKGTTTIDLGKDANGNPMPVPANWKVGDHLIIPGTQAALPYYLGGAIDASDEVTIASIKGSTFTLSTPRCNTTTFTDRFTWRTWFATPRSSPKSLAR